MHTLALIEAACRIFGLDPLADGLQLLEARTLAAPHQAAEPEVAPSGADGAWSEIQGVGPYTPPLLPYPLLPARPALICRLAGADAAAGVQAVLLQRYPPDHPVALTSGNGEPPRALGLAELSAQRGLDEGTCLFVPALDPLADLRGPDGVAVVVARLLGPGGCPWDREQTHRSLRGELLEEAYEVLEAIDGGDFDALAEELGDLLLSVLMHGEMARQAGRFDLGDVFEGIAAKLIRRHPHIFGETIAADSGEVLRNWEAIKQAERAAKGKALRGTLDGVPAGLPSLMAAQELTRKAAKAGFDSPEIDDVWAKLHEEVDEVRAEASRADLSAEERQARLEEELGDMLQAAARLGWRLGVDAESALRAANAKFRRRFAALEDLLRESSGDLRSMSVPEKIALWHQAKRGTNIDQESAKPRE